MSDRWENKEIAMANIFTLVGKPLLFFFVLIEEDWIFSGKPKGKLPNPFNRQNVNNDFSFPNVALLLYLP